MALETSEADSSRPKSARILFVDNTARHFFDYRMPLARRCVELGFQVHLAVPPPIAYDFRASGVHVHELCMSRRGRNPLREIRSIAALRNLYVTIAPDLVHLITLKSVFCGTLASLTMHSPPVIIGALTGLGYVFVDQTLRTRSLRSAIAIAMRLPLRIAKPLLIFQNDDDRQCFLSMGLAETRRSVVIRGSGVDTDRFSYEPEPPGSPVVFLAARMLWHKGIQEYVQAARIVRLQHPEVKFILAGDTDDGNPAAIPTSQLREWHASGAVEWLGWRSDLSSLLKESHIACLPSYREGVPLFLLEAASSGRPVVTTDVAGCREVVRHGMNGLLVKAKNSVDLAEAVNWLISNPIRRREMGLRSRELAQAEFGQEGVIEQTLGIYSRLLERRPR